MLYVMTSASPPRQTSKPGPPGSWEDVAADELRLRRIAELVTQGHSYRAIAAELGIA
jgi:DNA-binding NarL/FixJ family response regulator